MEQIRIFSADSHVNEPPDAWDRIPKNLRTRGPHFVQDPPGFKGLYMVFEGHEPDAVGMTFTAGIDKADGGIRKVIENFKWDDWRGPWDPIARLNDMDRDGVEMEVLYPSMARNLYSLKGDEIPLQKAAIVAYNDWLREYCLAAPKRLVGLSLLSALDAEWSEQEFKRCVKLGHNGVLLPSELPVGLSYADPAFDRLWAMAQDSVMPVHFHAGIIQSKDRSRLKEVTDLERGLNSVRRAILEPLTVLTHLIFGGVLERFPGLRIVLAEYDLCWLHPFLTKMDASLRKSESQTRNSAKFSALPSEYIKRQVYATFQEDRIGVLGAEMFDMLDNYMWASDYPHGNSTWPRSREAIRTQFAGLPNHIKSKLTWDNAARLYGTA
jgi:predicted TIM-barrel fold metal-dependent hydrolase